MTGFTLGYMAIWLFSALFNGNEEFLYYFVVMCILIAGVAALHFRVRFPVAALWGLSIWGLLHMAGGLIPVPESWPTGGNGHVLYNLWLIPGYLKYDQLVHAYGFGLVTWVCWIGLRRAFAGSGLDIRPTVGLLVLCGAGGMGFGAFNEIVEFIATKSLPDTNVGGYDNTGWDLVANFVGCLVAATVIYVCSKTSKGEQE